MSQIHSPYIEENEIKDECKYEKNKYLQRKKSSLNRVKIFIPPFFEEI